MSKFSCLQGNEGYDACGDAVPPRPPKEKDILGQQSIGQQCLQKTFIPASLHQKCSQSTKDSCAF